MKTQKLTDCEMALGEAFKLWTECRQRNCTGNLGESGALALEVENIEDMVPIDAAAAMCDNYKDGIKNPKSHTAATEALFREKSDSTMKQDLDRIRQQ